MKTRSLVSLVAALFAIGFSGLSVGYAAEFEWGDTTALKEHFESHDDLPKASAHCGPSFSPSSTAPTYIFPDV